MWYAIHTTRFRYFRTYSTNERNILIPMVIDIHTHTFPDRLAATTIPKLELAAHTRSFSDGTNAGLAASMARAGVDCSLVLPVATAPKQVVHVNDCSAQINERFPETGIFSFGCIHPDFSDYRAELARAAELGLKGIKLHPVYQGVDFDDIRTLRILDRAAELGLIVLSHSGLDVGFPGVVHVTPRMVRSALDQVGPMTLILAHMGGWRNWDQVEELLPDTSVYLDTSYSLGDLAPLDDGFYLPEDLPMMPQEQFLRMVRTFGPHRILFGTDSPWQSQTDAVAAIRALPLSQEEQDGILGGNAQKLAELPGICKYGETVQKAAQPLFEKDSILFRRPTAAELLAGGFFDKLRRVITVLVMTRRIFFVQKLNPVFLRDFLPSRRGRSALTV
ncbi:MAG: amidohydrolase family protein [Oscillospiraceae bacterium]